MDLLDKDWMNAPQNTEAYIKGVERFLDFAFQNTTEPEILCPCIKCLNRFWYTRAVVFNHLIVNKISKSYNVWNFHGEGLTSRSKKQSGRLDGQFTDGLGSASDDMTHLLHDVFRDVATGFTVSDEDQIRKGPDANAKKFYKLLEDADDELYLDCKGFSVLSFTVRLYLLKCVNGWSNSSFTDLLKLLKEVFPFAKIPSSFQHVKKMVKGLGLDYERIHACPNDCMLYWNEYKDAKSCHVCKTSRWKLDDKQKEEGIMPIHGIPAKVLRYFPLKPRLQRLFMSSKTAKHMIWHDAERTKDGTLRHPADGKAWKDFDSLHPDFASNPRNVRLSLTSDGFNPFRTMSVTYSIWPVVLSIYNLPPWLCNKSEYSIMSLIIPCPRSPGYDIDVYLQPLIQELKELWHFGVDTYDALKDEMFSMRAALLWTINDFPAYSMLSGWSTKGRLACPICNHDTCSMYLYNSRKFCYMGHRRFLNESHTFRRNRASFDGNMETRPPPSMLSGVDILTMLEGFQNKFGKTQKKSKEKSFPFKKTSIFFQLPYWRTNMVRHNLDVMHIEKNICDNILGTLLDIPGKTKDHLNARLDLKDMGIRKDLQPQRSKDGRCFLLSKACFSMTAEEKTLFCKVIKGAKFPYGSASNIARSVHLSERKISGYKSHDAHFLIHNLLQVAVRRTLPKQVAITLIRLGAFFRGLCSKVIHLQELDFLQSEIIDILCQLERIFVPSFFDVMVHLSIHLVDEVRLGGPVQYRWMFSKERYLGKLKSYVKNRCRPEASIAEGYLAEECLIFCSHYLRHDASSKLNQPSQHGDNAFNHEGGIFPDVGRPLGGKKGAKGKKVSLDHDIWTRAHRYVLFNCDKINEYIREHEESINNKKNRRKRNRWSIAQSHANDFVCWFKERIEHEIVSKEIRALSRGPNYSARSYKGYLVNGYKFHVASHDAKRKTQCSGVTLSALTSSFASSRDKNPIMGDVTYYGVLQDIIELDYFGHFRVVLFNCKWFDSYKDEYGLTCVNFKKVCFLDDPFVMASQVHQVFYVQDPIEEYRYYVIKTIPRGLFDMDEELDEDNGLAYVDEPPALCTRSSVASDASDHNVDWLRNDLLATAVEIPATLLEAQSQMTIEPSDDEIEDDTLWDFLDAE